MFILGLPTLVNHKERTREFSLIEIHGARKGPGRLHETSDKYACFQKIVLLFQRITVILENYNQQNHSLYSRKLQLAKPFSTSQKLQSANSHSRQTPQEREKGRREMRGGEV